MDYRRAYFFFVIIFKHDRAKRNSASNEARLNRIVGTAKDDFGFACTRFSSLCVGHYVKGVGCRNPAAFSSDVTQGLLHFAYENNAADAPPMLINWP